MKTIKIESRSPHSLIASKRALTILVCAVLLATGGLSAKVEDEPTSDAFRYLYALAKKNIVGGAEKMPEADYPYKPAPEVRSFGQLVAHIADIQYLFCSSIRNESNPNGEDLGPGDPSDAIEQGKSAKADLIAALREIFAYCDAAFEGLEDAQWGDRVTLVGNDRAKASPLMLTLVHLWEHYGNMVTYLRLRGIVPPSSESQSRR
jgi:uncharacterized damage-inducible protein DinB